MFAVLPAVFAPLQAFLSFLPQIAIALVAAATAIFRPQAYRWAWATAKQHKRVSVPLVSVCVIGLVGGYAWKRHARASVPPPTEEQKREGWWSFRANEARTGSDGKPVRAQVEAGWKFRPDMDRKMFTSSPAVWAGRVYIGCDNEALYCLNAETGAELWTAPTNHQVFSSPTVAEGRVYFGEGLHQHTDAKLYCVDAVSGKELWNFPTTSHVECAPTVADGRVYVGAGDDGVYCLDAATGAKIWQSKGMHVDVSPLLVKDLLIVGAGYGETGVAALRASDGSRAWFTPLPASAWGPAALGPRGVIVGIGNGNFEVRAADPKAEVVCLSLEGGGVVWRTPLRDAVLASAAVEGERVWLGDRSGDLSCFDANTGRRLWKSGCGHAVLSSAAIVENAIVYGCDGGHVHAVTKDGGAEIWRYDTKDDAFNTDRRFLSSPAVVGGRTYIGCNNFFVYCLK